jgi:cullin 1
LLAGKTNEDAERSMIARFKAEYGAYFTSKLEGMLNDMQTSQSIQKRFTETVSEDTLGGISLDVQVLNSLHWPIYKSEGDQIVLPKELVDCQKSFDKFYQSTTQNRKLTWVYSTSNAMVQLKYGKAKFDLMCTTYQACIMLMFNSNTSHSFKDIKAALGLSEEDLAMCIEPLCGMPGKFKLLTKTNGDEPVTGEDVFSWNDDLPKAKPPRRIPVPPTSGRANKQQTASTNKAVEEERKYKIDAAVVRIMKARRRMHINDLMAEVLGQLTKYFKPDPKMIKKCLESLIDREYLDRDEDDTNTFRYIT